MTKHIIGIDLGGTSVKYALINDKGEFLVREKLPSLANISAKAVVRQLIKAIEKMKEYAFQHAIMIDGVGVGTPGIVDDTSRIVLGGAENITGWERLPLADLLEHECGIAVRLVNDANAMGLAELKFGAAKGDTHVVFLTVGTGIGGAMIIDGKLFNGYANRGGELGHVPLIANGEKCPCGAQGCLEVYASTSALVRHFSKACIEMGFSPGEEINGELIVRMFHKGMPVAIKSLETHCHYLGMGIAGFINIFSPQKVVIGGGLSEAGEFYMEMLRREVFSHAMPDAAVNTKVVPAALGNNAGCLGAASMWFC